MRPLLPSQRQSETRPLSAPRSTATMLRETAIALLAEEGFDQPAADGNDATGRPAAALTRPGGAPGGWGQEEAGPRIHDPVQPAEFEQRPAQRRGEARARAQIHDAVGDRLFGTGAGQPLGGGQGRLAVTVRDDDVSPA